MFLTIIRYGCKLTSMNAKQSYNMSEIGRIVGKKRQYIEALIKRRYYADVDTAWAIQKATKHKVKALDMMKPSKAKAIRELFTWIMQNGIA